MALRTLSLDSLHDFDEGRAGLGVRDALKRVALDIKDRPGDKAARQVLVKINATPVQSVEGVADEASVEVEVITKLPPMRTRTRPVEIRNNGQLTFNDLAPDNPRQHTIDEVTEGSD